MKRIFSGVRPTGDIHLGNYLGAIKNWVTLQHQAEENLFCVVDLHALSSPDDSRQVADHTRTVAAAYLAAGLNPKRCSIFAQSHVWAHSELAWILGCLTPLGWLNRMTQFKDKAGKNTDHAHFGLFAYPVLMAADILLYKASHVPVGEDQKQHVEFTRDIAQAFNHRYEKEFFTPPEPLILGAATRVMSLRDGQSKMSKSDASDYSRINLMDSPDTIMLKIRKAKTDPEPLPELVSDLEKRPEAKNLMTIAAVLNGETLQETCQRYGGQLFSAFKQTLAELLIEKICPLGQSMHRYLQDTAALDAILKDGADKARAIAERHMRDIRDVIGLLPVV